jgi:Rhodopirellula transposase DDE domain
MGLGRRTKVHEFGDTADTAEFAVESFRRWRNQVVAMRFPNANRLLITAGVRGSKGYGVRTQPGRLGGRDRPGHSACHYPPGTSKWNNIEHRMFSFHRHQLAEPAAHNY